MFERLLSQFWHLMIDPAFLGDWGRAFAVVFAVVGLGKLLDWLWRRWKEGTNG